ncbi:MAG: sigma-70 family RNA polymerase sigma factor [Bacteroidota bacterium]
MTQFRSTGNASYMGEIYKRYAHLVMGTCIKYLKDEVRAQDAVMDLFAKLLSKLSSFTPENFPGWLYKVTRNHCLEIIRKAGNSPAMESIERTVGWEYWQEEEEAAYVEREIAADEIEAALKELPERQANCIRLFYLRGLSYKEVAEVAGFNLKEVKSHIQNGKRNLRKHLDAFARQYNWKKSI